MSAETINTSHEAIENVLVSACLIGLNCRYNRTSCYNDQVILLSKKYHFIPICPEQMGGLPTPRFPIELVNSRAVDKDGADFTVQFENGADEVVTLAKTLNCTYAILKSRSPSCGCGVIYDGTFSGTLTIGNGITAEKLLNEGIKVVNESNLSGLY